MEELYHVINRGVDGRIIFIDTQDYARFVHNMYECNDKNAVINNNRAFQMRDVGDRSFHARQLLIDIHGWCLMNNHFHLILSPRTENGISLFLQKVNVGYVKYFNEKYKRSGTLFQGKTKKIQVKDEAHFFHILHYVHLNPLDYLQGAQDWRDYSIQSIDAALAHLHNYKWSSYLDYCGAKNFPSIITKDLFSAEFLDYQNELQNYLSTIQHSQNE